MRSPRDVSRPGPAPRTSMRRWIRRLCSTGSGGGANCVRSRAGSAALAFAGSEVAVTGGAAGAVTAASVAATGAAAGAGVEPGVTAEGLGATVAPRVHAAMARQITTKA